MKKAILLLIASFVISDCFAQVDYGSCDSVTSGSPCFFSLYAFWIQTVSFGTLNFTGGTCDDNDGYQNLYDVDSGMVTAGNTYTFTMSRPPPSFFGGNQGGFYSAWVDWNNDGSFSDPGDLLFTVTGSNNEVPLTQSFTVTVPSTATTGEHRLRVRSDQADPGGNPNACATTGSYGDTKDFQIDVVGGRTAACLVTIHTPWDNGAQPICLYGCSATISASAMGVAPFTYSWSTVADTDSVIYNACAGSYSVTMTDSNGCVATATTTISQPDSMSVTAVVNPIRYNCDSLIDGSVILTTTDGGAGGSYSYLWGNGLTTQNLDTTSIPGKYCLSIVDAKGCMADTCFNIGLSNLPLSLHLAHQDPSGSGNNGSITVHASGGKLPYSYVWSPNISNDSMATGLVGRVYEVCVLDSNGCEVCDTVTLVSPCSVTIHTPWDNGANPTCLYGCSATLSATPTGAGPFSYSWSPVADTDSVLNNACAGTYSVSMTDHNGCISTDTVTINQPDSISVTAIVQQIGFHCDTLIPGFIHIISVEGGVGHYAYMWSNDSTTDSLDSIGEGMHCVIITDGAGCSVDTCFLILAPPPPPVFVVQLMGQNPTCFGCTDGSITAVIIGGTRPYLYSWSPAGQTDSTVTGLGANTYTVCVTDNNGCQACDTITLSVPLLVKEFSTGSFNISPNPVTDELTIVPLNLHEGILKIDIYNVLGEVLKTEDQDFSKLIVLDLKSIPSGIYFVRVTSENQRCLRKFVKE